MTPATKDQLPKEVRERIELNAFEYSREATQGYDYDHYKVRAYTAGATHEALRAQRLEAAIREALWHTDTPQASRILNQALAEAGGA